MYLHTAPHDYIDVNEELRFRPMADGCDVKCVDITILNDSPHVFELDEYFYVLLSTTDHRVSIRGLYATVRIQNSAAGLYY